MKQVKIGFDYEGIYYKSGTQVSEEICELFPDNVKQVRGTRERKTAIVEENVIGSVAELPEIVKQPIVVKEKPKRRSRKFKK